MTLPSRSHVIEGRAAALRIENLDTDQIMPKQFLRGIDKRGLADGVLHDLRFDGQGRQRPAFVLNRPEHAGASILLGGANFGCGSSREHAVWGLQQFGIRAIVAPSFAEIFHGNAVNNGLLLIALPSADVHALMTEAETNPAALLHIDVARGVLRSSRVQASFALSARYRRMLLEGLDVIGLTLTRQASIQAHAAAWRARHPWLADVASRTRMRLQTD